MTGRTGAMILHWSYSIVNTMPTVTNKWRQWWPCSSTHPTYEKEPVHKTFHVYRKCKLVINTFMLYSVPANTKTVDQFMDFIYIYLSQVIQAFCVDTETQHYRRLLSTDGILTSDTMYRQLVGHSHLSTSFHSLYFFLRRAYEHNLVSVLHVPQ